MKIRIALLASCLLPLCCVAQLPGVTNSLSDELLEVVEHRLKAYGPDAEIAQFLSVLKQGAWKRRDTIFDLTYPHLVETNAIKAAGAISVLSRLREARLHDGPVGRPDPEEVKFVAKLDAAVLGHFSHFKSLHNDDLYRSLSAYLGTVDAAEASQQLKAIAAATPNNEQALICLCWHRNPSDMDFLLPYLLSNTPAARSLPYHFRNSYGKAAAPYLQRAISEAKSQAVREETQQELKYLKQ